MLNSRRKILFILNPKAGHGKAGNIVREAERLLDQSKFEIHFSETEYAGHAKLLAKKAADEHYDYVACAGGDGTVNEVASSLKDTETALLIIPAGSGNGLARHLQIPMNAASAIALLNKGKKVSIDTFSINNLFTINVAGVGFDALVAHRFAEKNKRGLKTYIKTILAEYATSKEFEAEINGTVYKAWLISIANSGQFGNNAWIAPVASCTDGILDIIICKKQKGVKLLTFAVNLFSKRLSSADYTALRSNQMTIKLFSKQPLHLDGEPAGFTDELNIYCNPLSLKVIVPQHVE